MLGEGLQVWHVALVLNLIEKVHASQQLGFEFPWVVYNERHKRQRLQRISQADGVARQNTFHAAYVDVSGGQFVNHID